MLTGSCSAQKRTAGGPCYYVPLPNEAITVSRFVATKFCFYCQCRSSASTRRVTRG